MKKLYLTIITLLFTINIKAYENNYFNIDIPNNFIQNEIKEPVYEWTNKNNQNETIVITIAKNENIININNYTDTHLNEYEEYIKKQLNEQLNNYNVNIEVNNLKKEKINDLYCINYDVYWNTKDQIEYNIYQKAYVFTVNDLAYVYNFTSDKELNENKDLINSLNSFKPKKITSPNNLRIKLIIIIGSSAAVIGTIIKFILKKKRHKSNN